MRQRDSAQAHLGEQVQGHGVDALLVDEHKGLLWVVLAHLHVSSDPTISGAMPMAVFEPMETASQWLYTELKQGPVQRRSMQWMCGVDAPNEAHRRRRTARAGPRS